jgi:CHASE2 domain-containing sensor protein
MRDNATHSAEHSSLAPESLSESYGPRILIILGVSFVVAYLVLGDRVLFGHVATLELDAALRGALVGRYDPKTILPLALVAIDEATAAQPTPSMQSWGFSGNTPRDKLAAMLGVIAAAAPAAIIVDVDLSDDKRDPLAASPADQVLQTFLSSYAGPSLVFVKRVETEPDGAMRLAPSTSFDRLIAANSRLSWAHALYVTDADGTVRRWTEWIVSCAPSGPVLLPSVPLRVLATWREQSAERYPRPAAVISTEPCPAGVGKAPGHTVIYDEALLRTGVAMSRNVSKISAWQLLDPRIQRDDAALFAGKVVVVGGTRNGTADLWRTPVGMLYGVELIANTVRFAPGQLRDSGFARAYTLAFFLLFCVLKHFLRPIVALAAGILLCTAAAYAAGPYVILDSIQSAIVLFVELTIVEEIIILSLDARSFGWRFFVSNHLRRHA